MNDYISRQAAIDALHMHLMYRMGTDSNKKRLDDWINSLPPAQPETHDKRTGTHACDCISRQAAIDALDVLCQEHRYRIPGKRETYSQYNEAWQDALDRAEGVIGIIPSAQPSSSCSHEKDVQPGPEEPFEKCSDCIHAHDSEDICVLRRCKHAIAETVECFEPKQPERKRGRWNCSDDMYESAVCSVCGWDTTEPWDHILHWFNYCPNCGADMREVDDERPD